MDLVHADKNSLFTPDKDGTLVQIHSIKSSTKYFKKIAAASRQLKRAENANRIAVLYRGESKKHFNMKTGTPDDWGGDPVYERFFVLGSKAKSYLVDRNRTVRDIEQFDRNGKIEYIWNRLELLANNSDDSRELTMFRTSLYETAFRDAMQAVQKRDDQITLENYYLAYIHTKSSDPVDIRANSVLLSSTRDFDIATSFAQHGFIIVFWLKNSIATQAIDYQNLEQYHALALKYSLPPLDRVHFPDELEVTVFSAIFPHNIFYVYDISNNKYIVNPYLIETDLRSLVTQSINVDQTLFDDYIKGLYSRNIWRRDTHLLFEEDE